LISAKSNLLDDTGKFYDEILENNYLKYVERNRKAGKPVRDRLEWKQYSDYWTKQSPIARGTNIIKRSKIEIFIPTMKFTCQMENA